MKRLTIAIFATALLGGSAVAADLGGMKDRTVYDAPSSSSSNDWSGVYVGGHIGYGWYGHDVNATHTEVVPGTPASCKVSATMGDDGKCYTTIETPAVPASCKDGAVLVDNSTCMKDVGPVLHVNNMDLCFNSSTPYNGRCWKNDDTLFVAPVEASTHQEEDPTAYIPAVDASTTVTNLLQSIDTDNFIGGFRLGADYQPSGSRIVFGVFGDYDLTNAKETNQVYDVSIEDGNSWLIAGRLGYTPNDRLLAYGLVGFGGSDVTYKSGGDSIDESFTHLVLGAGLEYKFAKNISGYVEYQHGLKDKETVYQDDVTKVTDDRDFDKIMVGVNYRFMN